MSLTDDLFATALWYHRAGNLAEAERAYREILRLDPEHVDALNALGAMAGSAGAPEAAAEYFRRAVALRPAEALFHRNLATACKDAGQAEAAEHHYQEALRLEPNSPRADAYLAEVLAQQGRFEDAVVHNRRALGLDPDMALAYCNLGELAAQGFCSFSEEEVRRLETLVGRSDLPAADAVLLHFTLASLLDQRGECDRAFAHYRQGNELKRLVYRQAGRAFDAAGYRRIADAVMAYFTDSYFQRVQGLGNPSEVPVFVVGMVRSGTTLVEQVLASHPQVHGAGELHDIEQLARSLPGRLGTSAPFPDCVPLLEGSTVRQLADLYLARLTQHAAGAVRVVDKMPHNFLYLGLIATLLPRARIIHCRRNPRDLGASIYFQNFKWMPHASRFEDIAAFYEQYCRLMAHWHKHLPLPIHEVAYEEMVADLEGASRRLVAFCGLEWDDRCRSFHQTRRTVQTASNLQVRRPIYRTSLGRWQRYESHLKPLLDALDEIAQRVGGEPPPAG